LVHKQHLYPEESEIIAEAHFKLSLALEFASIRGTKEEGGGSQSTGDAEAQVDEGMRDEAVKELEAALNSTKLKLQNKEVELASSSSPDDNEVTRAQIADVKEIVADMEGRVSHVFGSHEVITDRDCAARRTEKPFDQRQRGLVRTSRNCWCRQYWYTRCYAW
jgi:HAT1-interacting factor 1